MPDKGELGESLTDAQLEALRTAETKELAARGVALAGSSGWQHRRGLESGAIDPLKIADQSGDKRSR